jgi:cation diffusion facilitator family transporter
MIVEAPQARWLPRYAWISAWVAVVTIVLKATAWALTGSIGLLSDALESFVNLATALLAIAMLNLALRPEDDEHPYGHNKAEYFSSGVEGALVLLTGVGIAVAAVRRFLQPHALEQLGLGVTLSGISTAINLGVALLMLRAGRRHRSVTLEANGHHLLADVWTSVAVVAGLGAVALTGRHVIDPAVALLVAGHVSWTGISILRRTATGLMDSALSTEDQAALQRALSVHVVEPVQVHALKSRVAGVRRFVSLHVLVPGDWTVQRGHELLEQIEGDIRGALPNTSVLTHLESLEDPTSWDDISLDRGGSAAVRQETSPPRTTIGRGRG